MNTNRRDLLKLFGIGAAVVPIVGGLPVPEAQASLIEVPKVKLSEPCDNFPQTILDIPPKQQKAIIYWRNYDGTGITYRMKCYMIKFNVRSSMGVLDGLLAECEFVVDGEVTMEAVK